MFISSKTKQLIKVHLTVATGTQTVLNYLTCNKNYRHEKTLGLSFKKRKTIYESENI